MDNDPSWLTNPLLLHSADGPDLPSSADWLRCRS
jgi:hypothetical protein